MIDRKILAAEARSRGIAVSDEELSEFLIKNFGLEKITAQEWENTSTTSTEWPLGSSRKMCVSN